MLESWEARLAASRGKPLLWSVRVAVRLREQLQVGALHSQEDMGDSMS